MSDKANYIDSIQSLDQKMNKLKILYENKDFKGIKETSSEIIRLSQILEDLSKKG